jgi:competence protein ComFC
VLSIVRNALHILYPLRCGGCGAEGSIFCKACADTLRAVEEPSTCPVCGRWIGERIVCGECITETRGFQEGFYGFYFENRLRDALHAFKFQGRKDVGKCLVAAAKSRIAGLSEKIDIIVPIPVTEKRLRERGFNQSFIIAEEIAAIIEKPVYHSVLFKTKETRDQYSLSRSERQKNVRGVFSVKAGDSIRGKRILLVDDLFTTGYTIREASKALTGKKPAAIVVFALARTPS